MGKVSHYLDKGKEFKSIAFIVGGKSGCVGGWSTRISETCRVDADVQMLLCIILCYG